MSPFEPFSIVIEKSGNFVEFKKLFFRLNAIWPETLVVKPPDFSNIIERIPMTVADDDWIRAVRLQREAEAKHFEAKGYITHAFLI